MVTTTEETPRERNLRLIREVLAVLPSDRWTSYGVIAGLTGLGARQVGGYMSDPSLHNAYQVLDRDGRISQRFRWPDPERSDDPRTLLESQGIVFDGYGRAGRTQMFTVDDFRALLPASDTEAGQTAVIAEPTARTPVLVEPAELDDLDHVKAVEQQLAGRTGLNKYGNCKRLLFAAELILDLEDVHAVAAEALTDGPDDKACDFVYVDRELGLIVLAQAYEAGNPSKKSARQDKAMSLHQAVSWLFYQDVSDVPNRIRSAVEEIHAALYDNAIREIKVWYVHNLPESKNVEKELAAIQKTVSAAAKRFSDAVIEVNAEEIGRHRLAEWYRTSRTPILVADELEIPASTWLSEQDPGWTAYSVTVPALWLNQLHWQHGEKLFSANVRGYLGHRKVEGNINQGIRNTLQNEPQNFWVYNNGITAVVDDAWVDGDRLIVRGLSIINGAQTAGALSDFRDEDLLADTKVSMRLVRCDDSKTLDNIIRFNNRQNPTEPMDYRSNDRVQRRLVAEFADLGIHSYTGGRRGVETRGKGGPDLIEVGTAAQALAAFHGMPGIAQQMPKRIWEDDVTYGFLFSASTSARHLIFCWTLRRAIEAYKQALMDAPYKDQPTLKQEQRDYLNRKGSILLMVAAIGGCLDDLIDRAIPDSRLTRFSTDLPTEAGIATWRPVVEALVPHAPSELGKLLTPGGPARDFNAQSALKPFRSRIGSMLSNLEKIRAEFKAQVTFGR
ncbi:AIPR family protein [Actinoallomurus iriomotensis]|uniref:Abortive phage infection protein C-terminal domain-containing protein n=1 Tax=Actinoallomurus iriomotensis TaxID=478107 RepID=A0A9W6W0P4_9ACTN|nr:AIPR family protein [Actinoallomurus iriomotensis]GLY85972.1 hypothetical protein Airi02_039010 [Actinoallomurus iriomotensis]